jgi:BlaI family transcriptional regulator, penicillinase repressor
MNLGSVQAPGQTRLPVETRRASTCGPQKWVDLLAQTSGPNPRQIISSSTGSESDAKDRLLETPRAAMRRRKRIRRRKETIDIDEDFRHNSVMDSKRRRPNEAELAILRVLWEGKAQTVRAIHNVLNESRPTGYTTVLKLMQIMTEKGLVERDESCRPQLYRASYTQQQTQRQLLGDLMNRAFGGSMKALVLEALATRKSSPQELEAMEKLLDRIEGGKK